MKGNQRRGSHLCRCCLQRQVPCICPGPWGDTGTMSQPRSVLAGLRWGWERLMGRACPAAFALDPLSPLSHALLSLHLGTELFAILVFKDKRENPAPTKPSPLSAESSPRASFGPAQSFPPTEGLCRRPPSHGLSEQSDI